MRNAATRGRTSASCTAASGCVEGNPPAAAPAGGHPARVERGVKLADSPDCARAWTSHLQPAQDRRIMSALPMRCSNMRVTILGRGPLAEPLAQLAERAGHAMIWVQEAPAPWPYVDAPDLVILAGSSTAVQTLLGRIAPSIADCRVVVDATI